PKGAQTEFPSGEYERGWKRGDEAVALRMRIEGDPMDVDAGDQDTFMGARLLDLVPAMEDPGSGGRYQPEVGYWISALTGKVHWTDGTMQFSAPRGVRIYRTQAEAERVVAVAQAERDAQAAASPTERVLGRELRTGDVIEWFDGSRATV